MKEVIFITGSQKKADYLANLLGHPIEHKKVDLNEIQSLDLREIVKYKLREAYAEVSRPVLVEDVSLEFTALGKLPGTFIKFFLEQMGDEILCRILDGRDRSAIARCVFGYYDGKTETYFEASTEGSIAENPAGENGYGFDKIFIPKGYEITRAQLPMEDHYANYLKIKPIEQVRDFLLDTKDSI